MSCNLFTLTLFTYKTKTGNYLMFLFCLIHRKASLGTKTIHSAQTQSNYISFNGEVSFNNLTLLF